MSEDVQPNERSFVKKGSAIPIVRSTAARGRTKGAFGRPNGPSHPSLLYPPNSRHHGRSVPSSGTREIEPLHRHGQHRHDDGPSTHGPRFARTRSPSHGRAPMANMKRRHKKTRSEFLGFPCGNPETSSLHHITKERQFSGNPSVRSCIEDPARLAADNISLVNSRDKDHGNRHATNGLPSSWFTASETLPKEREAFIHSGNSPQDQNFMEDVANEVIICGNVDNLEIAYESPLTGEQPFHLPLDSPHPDSDRLTIHEMSQIRSSLEPLRAFRSGILSITACSVQSSSIAVPMPLQESEFGNSLGSLAHLPKVSSETSAVHPVADVITSANISGVNSIAYGGKSTLSLPQRTRDLQPVSLQLSMSQDKLRRVLFDGSDSLVLVSMHGAFHNITLPSLKCTHTSRILQSPGGPIDDACLLATEDRTLVLLGHARDNDQVSWFQSQVSGTEGILNRPCINNKKGGVSAITNMIQPLQFATGGYDHIVHLWVFESNISTATSRPLAIKHSSHIQSLLAIQDTSHKLISAGADCNINIWDLSSERTVNILKTSNMVYHVHQTPSPFCTLSEVANRELQFEVRDHRAIPEKSVVRFGYTIDRAHGRFMKGDVSSHLFASGGRDGLVRLWDLRNVKNILRTATDTFEQKIVQVIFHGSQLLTCSETGELRLSGHAANAGP